MSTEAIVIVLGLYLIAGTLLAVLARRGLGQGVEAYFLANRTLGGAVSALSYSATTYSAFMMVGLAGLTYRGGVGALGFELIYLSGLALVAFFGPKFWLAGKRYGLVSPAELLAVRYDSRLLGMVVAVVSALFLIPYTAVQLTGIGLLLNGMSGGEIPVWVGLVLATVVAVVWSWLGGLRSVAWTDALQAILMMVTALWVVGEVLGELGGPGGLFGRLAAEHPEWLAVPGNGFFSFQTFLGLSLPWFFFSLSNPQVSQRLFAPRSIRALRRMLLGFLAFGFVYTLISVIWGFSGLLLFPALPNPDLATPTLLGSKYVTPVAGLLAMVGIAAAAISTVDSILLTLSSMISRDLYRAVRPAAGEPEELRIGKWVIPVIALLAYWFARLRLDLIGILAVASSAGLLVTVPALVGAFYWRRGTAAGALTSVLGGGLVVLLTQFGRVRPLGMWPGVWGILVAGILFVAVSLAGRAPKARAREFVEGLDPGQNLTRGERLPAGG